MDKVIVRTEQFGRGVHAVKCDCEGYATRVKCTPEEVKAYNCTRGYECCARAFVCSLCKARILGTAEAPECKT